MRKLERKLIAPNLEEVSEEMQVERKHQENEMGSGEVGILQGVQETMSQRTKIEKDFTNYTFEKKPKGQKNETIVRS